MKVEEQLAVSELLDLGSFCLRRVQVFMFLEGMK